MAKEFWARLEDPSGNVIGADPAWKPQRQFLWDVVHDTRGLLREETFYDDLELIRTIDQAPGRGGNAYALEPKRVRRVYETILERSTTHDAKFRLVAPAGKDEWAAVNFFEEGGSEYALVGGWTGPLLRTISPEPDQSSVPETGPVRVGSREFRIRSVPYHEYFRDDFQTLIALLQEAEANGLRVRFLQR